MQKELNKIAKDTNLYLKKFIQNQKKTELIKPMKYGLFSGGKKIRSKILIDIGSIFNLDHIKFGESTAVLAGNSLLTMAFEILSHKELKIPENIKIKLINKISESSGHRGIAGGQFLDLSFEHKRISKKRIIEMEMKKTGKLFSFCCLAPLIIKRRNKKEIKLFENIGSDIGLLFQVADDLIDYKGNPFKAGKKTGKDKKKGKATLISLLGYKNTIKYANNLILKINVKLKSYGPK